MFYPVYTTVVMLRCILLSKTVNTLFLLTIKDYRDSIDYYNIFRAAIVIVNFLLSPSTRYNFDQRAKNDSIQEFIAQK